MPSRYSRLAPPPVEMWPNWSSENPSGARPRRSRRLHHGEPALVGDLDQRLRDGGRARGIRLHLERTHRAVPEHRLAVLELLGEEARLGADVEAHPVGEDHAGGNDLVVGIGGELGGGDDVDGEDDLDPALLRLLEAPDGVDLVGLEEAAADLVVLRGT